MWRVLAATVAELFQFNPIRRRLPVLGRRIIPLFAITALQRDNFSGHKNPAPGCQLLAAGSNSQPATVTKRVSLLQSDF
jgi:hypothetical protein